MTPQTKTTVATIIAMACGGFAGGSIPHWLSVQRAALVGIVVAAVMGVLLYVLPSRPAA